VGAWSRRRRVRAALAGAVTLPWLAACGNTDPQAIANMPPPVQAVANTVTPTGHSIAWGMLTVTGNQGALRLGRIPGYYTYGPAEGAQAQGPYYVNFYVPVNLRGLSRSLGFTPHPVASTTFVGMNYVQIPPLPFMAADRLYYNPNTTYAPFKFKLEPNGQVLDESWDAVLVNG
jgi:hypothetical protein